MAAPGGRRRVAAPGGRRQVAAREPKGATPQAKSNGRRFAGRFSVTTERKRLKR